MRRTIPLCVNLCIAALFLLTIATGVADAQRSGAYIVSGKVSDEEKGTPLDGVQVRVVAAARQNGQSSFGCANTYELLRLAEISAKNESEYSALTDKDGRFKVEVPNAGDWIVFVLSPAHAHAGKRATLDDKTHSVECVFELCRPVAMKGLVWSENGEPIQGATVVASAQVPLWQPLRAGTTDKDGRYRIENLPPSPLQFFAVADGYAPAVWRDINPFAPAPPFGLQRLGKLKIAAKGPNMEPLQSFDVMVLFRAEGAEVDISRNVPDGKEGLFETELVPGEYLVVCSSKGLAPSETCSMLIEPGGLVEREILLQTGQLVRGKVVSKSTAKPLADATVRVLQPRCSIDAKTDSQGAFVLNDVPPGPVVLDVVSAGCARRVLAGHVVTTEKPLNLGSIEVAPPAAIRGHVEDRKGQPLAGWRVLLSGPNARSDVQFADKLGRFCFDGLESGRYQVAAGGEEYGLLRCVVIDTLGEGASHDLTMLIELPDEECANARAAKRRYTEEHFKKNLPSTVQMTMFGYVFPREEEKARLAGFYVLYSDEYGRIWIPPMEEEKILLHATYRYGLVTMSMMDIQGMPFDSASPRKGGFQSIFELPSTRFIVGEVVCEGKGVPNATVQAYATARNMSANAGNKTIIFTQQAFPSPIGMFFLAMVPPDSALRIIASRPGYIGEPLELTYEELAKLESAGRKSDSRDSLFKLELKRAPTGSLTVETKDRYGLPARALVVLRDADGKTLGMSTCTDRTGSAYFQALKPAVYAIYVEGEGAGAKCVERKVTVERDKGTTTEVVLE